MRIPLEKAAHLLQQGHVVAIPTETVYGLAASLHHPDAVKKIFTIKNRPQKNPLIVHVRSIDEAFEYSALEPDFLHALLAAFWPGPLTIVVPAQVNSVPEAARAGLSTVALRMPSHPLAAALLQQISPLVAPSANRSGKPSATDPEHVEADFGLSFPVLDGGHCSLGIESTILIYDTRGWRMGRRGALSREAIAQVLGYIPDYSTSEQPLCPGQLLKHYSPNAALTLSTISYEQCPHRLPVVVGFCDRQYRGAHTFFSFGASSNVEEVARNLYKVLRDLDAARIQAAWVDIDFPSENLWDTIRERLYKASQSNAQSMSS